PLYRMRTAEPTALGCHHLPLSHLKLVDLGCLRVYTNMHRSASFSPAAKGKLRYSPGGRDDRSQLRTAASRKGGIGYVGPHHPRWTSGCPAWSGQLEYWDSRGNHRVCRP